MTDFKDYWMKLPVAMIAKEYANAVVSSDT